MKKYLFSFFLFGILFFAITIYAQNINPLDQWTATTSPVSGITQRTYGKSIIVTGLTTGQCLTLDSNNRITTTSCGSGGGLSSYDAFTHPYTLTSATTSTMIFPGIITTASSTFGSSVFFPALSQGTANIGTNGLIYSTATSTIGAGTGLSNSGTPGFQISGTNNTLSVNTTQNITTLSNLTVAGTVNNTSSGVLYSTATSTPTVTIPITYSGTLGSFIGGATGTFGCTSASAGVTGCLTGTDWNTFNGKLGSYDPFTHPAAGQSATTSLLVLSGNASSTQLTVGSGATPTAYIGGTGASLAFGTTTSAVALTNTVLRVSDATTLTMSGIQAVGGKGKGALSLYSGDDGADNPTIGFTGSTLLISSQPDYTTLSGMVGKFYFTSGGNLGIGTTSPGAPLSVGNSGGLLFYPTATSTFGSSANGINITNGCFAIGGTCLSSSGGSGLTSYDPFSHPAALQSATSSLMLFFGGATTTQITATSSAYFATVNGGVGIGTTTVPSGTLNVYGTTTVQAVTNQINTFNVQNSAGVSALSVDTTPCSSTLSCFSVLDPTGASLFNTYSTGNTGLGTTSPWATFSIAGNASTHPFVISSTTVTTASSTLFMVDTSGDLHLGGGTPTLSSCGTGPSLGPNSTDQAGTFTPGSAATSCTITFATVKQSIPHCVVSEQTMSLVNALSYTETATALTVSQTSLSSKIDYICVLGH